MKNIKQLFIFFYAIIISLIAKTTIAQPAGTSGYTAKGYVLCNLVHELENPYPPVIGLLITVLALHVIYSLRNIKTCFNSPIYWLITIIMYLIFVPLFFPLKSISLLSNVFGGKSISYDEFYEKCVEKPIEEDTF